MKKKDTYFSQNFLHFPTKTRTEKNRKKITHQPLPSFPSIFKVIINLATYWFIFSNVQPMPLRLIIWDLVLPSNTKLSFYSISSWEKNSNSNPNVIPCLWLSYLKFLNLEEHILHHLDFLSKYSCYALTL